VRPVAVVFGGWLAATVALGACSLVTSLDGLSNGATDAGVEASVAEGGAETSTLDAGGDSGDGGDSGISREGCPTGKGPLPVRVDTATAYYCIDSTEVTRGQYDEFLSSSPVTTHPRCGFNTTFTPSRDWPYGPTKASYPVVGVDWCDAYEFCAWAGKHLCGGIAGGGATAAAIKDRRTSTIVHACSRDGTRTFPYGNTFDPTACNTAGFGAGAPIAVGTAPRCEGGYTGIFDLAGNVAEWLDSCDLADSGADDTCRAFNSAFTESMDVDLRCVTIRTDPRSYADSLYGFRCCSP
jgi:sulfatase modifying factor 1